MNTEQENKTHGPYFADQTPFANCGCYYPDVSRIPSTGAIYCFNHGFQADTASDSELPTEEWREQERDRLSKLDERPMKTGQPLKNRKITRAKLIIEANTNGIFLSLEGPKARWFLFKNENLEIVEALQNAIKVNGKWEITLRPAAEYKARKKKLTKIVHHILKAHKKGII